MADTASLLRILASRLSAAGVGAYAEGSVPDVSVLPLIAFKSLPAQPDRCIVLNAVVQGEDLVGGAQVMVQVRCRGARNDPLDVDAIGDAVRGVLHDLQNVPFGPDGGISQLIRRTSIPNGADELERSERIDQFYGTANFEAGLY